MCVLSVHAVVFALLITRIIKSVITGQVPVSQEWKNTQKTKDKIKRKSGKHMSLVHTLTYCYGFVTVLRVTMTEAFS